MAIAKKVRFEVFKRDKFTCQYCGKKAPDVVLEVDHVHPKSDGGTDDPLNLVTSCYDCNRGKGPRPLTDDSIVAQQRAQREEIEHLQERQDQLRMLIDWQRSLLDSDKETIDQLEVYWCELAGWGGITEEGRADLKKWVRQFGAEAVIAAMRISIEQYVAFDENDKPSSESTNHAFSKIGGVCHVRSVDNVKPYLKDLYYIRGILRKRFWLSRPWEVLNALERLYLLGVSIDELTAIAKGVWSLKGWWNEVARLLGTESDDLSDVM